MSPSAPAAGTGTRSCCCRTSTTGRRPGVPVAEALSKGADAVVLDLLGFGGSPAPLSSHFELEDHVAAVLTTLRKLFGDTPVKLVGHGFGALVALGCAGTRPAAVSRVVAFSPTLVPPGIGPADYEREPAVAELFAKRDSLVAIAHDERLQAIASERLESTVTPPLRSLSSVLKVDSASLIEAVQAPVRVAIPDRDTTVATRVVAAGRCDEAALRGHRADGRPHDAVPAASRGAERSLGTRPMRSSPLRQRRARPASKHRPVLSNALGSVSGQLVRRGALMLLAGLVLLLIPQFPYRLIPLGLAIYLLVEAIQTIVGAVGLRRAGKGWLPWVLIGGVSLLFALFLALREEFAFVLTWFVVAAWALGRGLTDLYIARKADEVPGRRWALAAEGVLSLTIAALLLLEPAAGGRLLRYTLGGYFTAAGALVAAVRVVDPPRHHRRDSSDCWRRRATRATDRSAAARRRATRRALRGRCPRAAGPASWRLG